MSNPEITVTFYRDHSMGALGATVVSFRIPDTAQILSRDPEEFMRWCYEQMMSLGRDAKSNIKSQTHGDVKMQHILSVSDRSLKP